MRNQLKPTVNAAKNRGYDIEECKRVIGDARTRAIEAKAREDADADVQRFAPPELTESEGYWNKVIEDMCRAIYITAHGKRLERIERMKNKD